MHYRLMLLIKKIVAVGPKSAILIATGLTFTLIMVGLFVFQPAFLKVLELKVYDAIFRTAYSEAFSDAIVIVDLDEKSLADQGQWPWPRYRVALMIEKIRRAGAASIGMDMIFAEEDRTSPRIIKEQLEREFGVKIGFAGLPEGLTDNDQVLANILANGPFAIGYYFAFQQEPGNQDDMTGAEIGLNKLQVAVLSEPDAMPMDQTLFRAAGVTGNIPVLADAAPGSGFINGIPDIDGTIRRTPLIISYKGEIYPSLALAVLMEAVGSRQVVIRAGLSGPESIRLADRIIPIDSRGRMLLNYRGPAKTFPYISAGDVLEDRIQPDFFEGKIVLVGTSAAGLKDIRTTPLDSIYPGVEVQATVVDNVLAGDFLYRPDWALGLEMSLVLAIGVLSTLLFVWLGSLWLIVIFAAGLGGLWFGASYLLKMEGLDVSPLMAILTLSGNFTLLTFQKFWYEEKEKRQIRHTFEHYLSSDVIKRIIKNPKMLKLGGEKRNLTILFTDIRSFTNISESMEPQELVRFMNEYLTVMTNIILKNGGTLDKYMGDAIMAFFGAPEDMPDHARIANDTAIEMFEKLYEFRKKWSIPGFPRFEIGVGISSGDVIVGNIGSEKRFNYTVMGDPVNLASRLEGLTKSYGVKTLISEYTREQAGSKIVCREIDRVRVKGKERPVAVYEPFGKDYFSGGDFAYIQTFEQGLAAYRDQKWDEALQLFKKTLAIKPEDKPSLVYIERCHKMAQSPPGPGWDGVLIMDTK